MGVLGEHNGVRKHVPWTVTDAAVATTLVFASFLAILVLLGLATDVVGSEERTLLAPWFIAISEGVMLAAVWAFGIRKYRARWQDLGLRRPDAGWSFMLPLLALVGSLAFTGIYTSVITTLGPDALRPPSLPEDVLGEGLPKLLNASVIVLLGPFTEEVFFRGFLLAALVPPLGAARAAAISAAVFAAAHLAIGIMVPIFVTGLLLSWLYLRTRSLWPPIAAHAAQNLIAVSFAL